MQQEHRRTSFLQKVFAFASVFVSKNQKRQKVFGKVWRGFDVVFVCLLITRLCMFVTMFSKEIIVDFLCFAKHESFAFFLQFVASGHTNHFYLPSPLNCDTICVES